MEKEREGAGRRGRGEGGVGGVGGGDEGEEKTANRIEGAHQQRFKAREESQWIINY